MREPLKWYDVNATDKPPLIKALAEVGAWVAGKVGVTKISKPSPLQSII
jgi:hypothetical protein